jgi:hypothetical protein
MRLAAGVCTGCMAEMHLGLHAPTRLCIAMVHCNLLLCVLCPLLGLAVQRACVFAPQVTCPAVCNACAPVTSTGEMAPLQSRLTCS